MLSAPLNNAPQASSSRPRCFYPRPPSSHHHDTVSRSSTTTTDKTEKLDITQRIERKLAQYNASQNIYKRWLFETLSWCLSAMCMAGVVGIYVRLKDEPINLPKSGVLLTAANVLGKIASAALIVPTSEALGQLKWNWFHDSKAMWDFEIFDKASRGPWGAIMLLFRTRGRSLAALGALLIVLLLAMDTFFQQVVDFPDRWSLEDVVSELPFTVRYDPGTGDVFREWIDIMTVDPDLFHVMEKFFYGNGTQLVPFGNGTRPDIPLSCPTSKCSWPEYETLGICSQCEDVSAYLDYACITGRVDWTADLFGGFNSTRTYPNATMCGYFLNATEADPVMMSGYEINANGTSKGETLVMRTLPLTTILDKEPLYGNGSIQFKHLRNTLADVLIVSAADGTAASVHSNIAPVAQECVLSWCVKTMRSSYEFGVYHEEVVQTLHNTTPGPPPWVSYPFVDSQGAGTDIFYLQDIDIVSTTTARRNTSDFGANNNTVASVLHGFVDMFPSFTTINETFAEPVTRHKIYREGPAYNRLLNFNPWLAPNNVTRHLERLATAMTNVIRSAPSNTILSGNAFSIETYISVHWEWLAFPFILLLLSLAFLALTIYKTSREREIGVWKTSAMPTLIYGLPQDVQKQLSSSGRNDKAAQKDARKVRIRLLPDQGWRISRQMHATPKLKRQSERSNLATWV